MQTIEHTISICPECKEKIPAEIFEKDKKIWISKECKKHGKIIDAYWEDAEMYFKAKNYAHDGRGIANPIVEKENPDCPFDCGLCKIHLSHTALANLVVTNRCDLTCWYCFFYAKEGDKIYEPSLEHIQKMFDVLRNEQPIAPNAIQLTGGEPSLREDIIEIVRMAKRSGFEHVQFNTNGIRLSREPDFARQLVEAGVSTLYLSFDGVSPSTNPKNYWEMPKIIENCRNAKLGIVLVPTVVNGINDHEIGKIVQFAVENIDIVRGVNFQPVSFVGRTPRKLRERQRITIPAAVKKLEEQMLGQIDRNDFYSIPCVTSISHFIEALTDRKQYELSNHFACGMATYLFVEEGKIIPITRFVDVSGLFKFLEKIATDVKNGKHKLLAKGELLLNISKFVDKRKQPKSLNLASLLASVLLRKNYHALGEMHHKTLLIGMMHFQDLYNYDVKRVQRCDIHYVTPDLKIVPFCAFNVLPELYRDKAQEAFSIPAAQWEKEHGKKIIDDFYKRKIPAKQELKNIKIPKPPL